MDQTPKLLSKNEVDNFMKSKGMNRKQRRDWFKKNKPVKATLKQEERLNEQNT